MKIPVLIDTDPGVDDFFALVLAAQSELFEIRAITPVAGNVCYEHVTQNALDIAAYLGLEKARVAKGCTGPMLGALRVADHVHGESGLGPVQLPRAHRPFDDKKAWDVLYEEAVKAEGKLQVIAIGPLTNIATALLLYPELKKSIAHLTIMGGSAKYGNSSPYGEFNIWVDPYAAKLVMESGIPITLLGLDTTHQCELEPEDLARMVGIESALHPVVDQLADFMVAQAQGWGGKPVIHDALAVASLIDEQVVRFKDCHVSVETRSPYTFGQTVIGTPEQAGKPANARVAYWADKERFIEDMKKAIGAYSKGGAHLCSQSI